MGIYGNTIDYQLRNIGDNYYPGILFACTIENHNVEIQ